MSGLRRAFQGALSWLELPICIERSFDALLAAGVIAWIAYLLLRRREK